LEDENAPTLESLTSSSKKPQQTSAQSSVAVAEPTTQQPSDDGLEGLESQADQEGAFNPETGEINWDCPCLGGMAHGPCGEDFKAAFSCFVFSTEEPKGMDCIEKFKYVKSFHPRVKVRRGNFGEK
jgi:intermembrane space import and assembly protein 40